MRNENIFKECTVCGFTWKYRQDFINDDEIEIVGYQVHFKELTEGFMLSRLWPFSFISCLAKETALVLKELSDSRIEG